MTAPILPPAEVEAISRRHCSDAVAYDEWCVVLASHEALRALLAEYREAVREWCEARRAREAVVASPDGEQRWIATQAVARAEVRLFQFEVGA